MSLCRWEFRPGWILARQGIRGCTFSKLPLRFRFELELFDHANWQTHSSHRDLRDGDGIACGHAAVAGASRYWLRYRCISADERSACEPWDSYSRALCRGES